LIILAVALLVLFAIVRPGVKNEDCAPDDVAGMFGLLHLVSCWALWRNFNLEKRRAIAGASLATLAVALVQIQLHSGCERYGPSLIADVLSCLLYLDDAAICFIAFLRSPEEKTL
jgi:hypothetical protein